ncbi:hypothetical protein PR202_gb29854 [Eleusine coracana subsp. coracana]|uniref:Uncharacterized protein n=1 Tax=Eleusine coracana subsp. coracana TaxID=191504 RepID=A0AAV5G136_ELECO|nr:hypothetical protein QOZ80_1BG0078490 [Eleusine coracana subsp. coracana]GJN40610.1 hypothetical protein PR202_gb29854 [Eleusine coracana subsp. coracana]
MLGRTTRGGTSSLSKARAEGAGVTNVVVAGRTTTIVTDGGQQEVTVSQFVTQLDEAARRRLDSMNQRLRLMEQQMETLEAEVGKANSKDDTTYA